MNDSLISVIVPVYKVEEDLNKCIDSILLQSHKNIELILVDDGSPDNCPGICNEYAKIDSRVVVIHQKNVGVSAARNAGIRVAKGDYIGFVDGDDYIKTNMYSEMLNEIVSKDCQMCVCTKYILNGEIVNNSSIDKSIFNQQEALQNLLQMNFPTSLWSCLYSKELLREKYLNEEIHFFEDFEFQFRVLLNAKQIAICNKAWYDYRQREGSANNQQINEKVLSCLSIPNIIELLLKDNNQKFIKLAHNLNVNFLLYAINSLAKSHKVNKQYYKIISYYSKKNLITILFYNKISLLSRFYILLCAANSRFFHITYIIAKSILKKIKGGI
jgi:glycosyltransferase involved in cell wall biosynthesis